MKQAISLEGLVALMKTIELGDRKVAEQSHSMLRGLTTDILVDVAYCEVYRPCNLVATQNRELGLVRS